jgi:hypothetical protein
MISGMEHQKPLWNAYRALRNMSRLCVLCPKGHTFLYSTTSTNQRFRGIFALLAAFRCLFAYCPLTHVRDDVLECEHGGTVNPRNVRIKKLMTTFQNSRYVGYGHLHVPIIYGRDKNIWPAAIVPQMLIKSPDQTF